VKQALGRAVGLLKSAGPRLKGLIPRAQLGRWWARRFLICSLVLLTIGPLWMVCGRLLEEPGAVLFGFALVAPLGLWAGYRVGKWFEDRAAAKAPPPPPPPEPEPAAKEPPKPAARPAGPNAKTAKA
jgi:hypothetical protein